MSHSTEAVAFRNASDEIKAVSLKNPLPVNPSLNRNGADYYADTSAHSGTWFAITATAAAVAALTCSTIAGTLTAVPIPAGATIYGSFTGITLASGGVIAYRA